VKPREAIFGTIGPDKWMAAGADDVVDDNEWGFSNRAIGKLT
jgi:hypothetical protein